jgi:hypothetical protein
LSYKKRDIKTNIYLPSVKINIPCPERRGMLFSRSGCTQGFNTFKNVLKLPREPVSGLLGLNPFGTNKVSDKVHFSRYSSVALVITDGVLSPQAAHRRAPSKSRFSIPLASAFNFRSRYLSCLSSGIRIVKGISLIEAAYATF